MQREGWHSHSHLRLASVASVAPASSIVQCKPVVQGKACGVWPVWRGMCGSRVQSDCHGNSEYLVI